MWLAKSLPFQLGIGLRLVDGLTVEVCEPGLQAPGRHGDEHSLAVPSWLDSGPLAGFVELAPPPFDAETIAVDQHDERQVEMISLRSIGAQLLDEALADKLLTRAFSRRRLLDPQAPRIPSLALQEPASKSLVLRVFADEDESGPSTQGTQPRAIWSERGIERSSTSGRPSIRVGASGSRANQIASEAR